MFRQTIIDYIRDDIFSDDLTAVPSNARVVNVSKSGDTWLYALAVPGLSHEDVRVDVIDQYLYVTSKRNGKDTVQRARIKPICDVNTIKAGVEKGMLHVTFKEVSTKIPVADKSPLST